MRERESAKQAERNYIVNLKLKIELREINCNCNCGLRVMHI